MSQIRVSASRLNLLADCSMKFYLGEVQKIPEKTWPRTHAGSASHSVLECLARDKHRGHHDIVKVAGSIYASPAVGRLVKAWQYKTKMSDEIVADIDGMCILAINETNFLDEGATRRFDPEFKFQYQLKGDGTVKGFIDRMAQFPDKWIIKDYKTARNKPTKHDVSNSYQSLMYQLFVWREFGALAEVHYYYLRHPPTKKTPTKHLMITPAPTEGQLAGMEAYIEFMAPYMNSFGLEEAHNHYHDDEGFCERVCTYRRPMDYIKITKKTGEFIGTFMLDTAPQAKEDEVAETLHFTGCPKFNS